MLTVHLLGLPGYFVLCGMYGGGILFSLQPWKTE
jgi:hypothetical protein